MQFLPHLPSFWWALLLLPTLFLCLWSRHFAPLLFFLAGVIWVTFRAGLLLQENLPSALEGRDLTVDGVIADLPRYSEHGPRFIFDVRHAYLSKRAVSIPATIQLSFYDAAFIPHVGDYWQFTVRLKRPHGFQNPGGFDYEGYLLSEHIRATGYIRPDHPAQLIRAADNAYWLGRFRQYLGTQISSALGDSPYASLLIAFVNGDETGISDQQWQVLQRTGTIHLVAISGMNISLVAGFIFFIVLRLWPLGGVTVLLWPAPKVAAVCAMIIAIGYAALAGFAIPTQRALVMLAVVMIGVITHRQTGRSHLLAAALLGVLIYDPLAVMAPGFWLSFASVAIILWVASARMAPKEHWYQWGKLHVGIAVGLLPLTLVLFQQDSLIGPLANSFAVPVIELIIIPLVLVAAVLLVFLPITLPGLMFKLAAWVLSGLWQVLTYLASIHHVLWVQPAPPPWTLVVALVGIVWLLAPRGWPVRWLGIVWLLPIFLVRPIGPKPGEIWLTLLDVGQGLAVVVRTHDHVLVYDTGPHFSPQFDAGRAAVVPYLRNMGLEQVDTLIISHGDNDHIGGAASLLRAMPVHHILSSVPERLPHAQYCRLGQRWRWDGVDFAILGPVDGVFTGNNACCILSVVSHYGKILLPGDIEAKAETDLTRRLGPGLASDILVAPHHGSKTSSTLPFITLIKPAVVLFPFGYLNRYHHPNADVVARYRLEGAQLYDSPAAGAIQVRLGADGTIISQYRKDHARYWFTQVAPH